MPPKKQEEPPNVVRFGRVKSTGLACGILGLPNVGKSSLFNLMTGMAVEAANYPFVTIEPNESRCPVQSAEYQFLCDLWDPPSKYPAYLKVLDIAGLIKGASEGAGLGNQFLSNVQQVDALYHVVRCFDNDEVVHVDDSVDPIRDLETIQTELCKKDLEFVTKAEAAEELAVRKGGGRFKLSPTFISAFDKMKKLLNENKPVRMGEFSTGEIELINEKVRLLTTKPVIYLANLSMADFVRKKNKWLPKIVTWIKEQGGGGTMIPFSVEYEQKIKEDPSAMVEGCPSVLPKIVSVGYSELNLIGFLTAGEKEVRMWTIPSGFTAPQAAGVIHSDFEKAFIKAEVVSFQDFKELCGGQKGFAAIKAAGKYRQEGKAYVVQPYDIIHFMAGTVNKGK